MKHVKYIGLGILFILPRCAPNSPTDPVDAEAQRAFDAWFESLPEPDAPIFGFIAGESGPPSSLIGARYLDGSEVFLTVQQDPDNPDELIPESVIQFAPPDENGERAVVYQLSVDVVSKRVTMTLPLSQLSWQEEPRQPGEASAWKFEFTSHRTSPPSRIVAVLEDGQLMGITEESELGREMASQLTPSPEIERRKETGAVLRDLGACEDTVRILARRSDQLCTLLSVPAEKLSLTAINGACSALKFVTDQLLEEAIERGGDEALFTSVAGAVRLDVTMLCDLLKEHHKDLGKAGSRLLGLVGAFCGLWDMGTGFWKLADGSDPIDALAKLCNADQYLGDLFTFGAAATITYVDSENVDGDEIAIRHEYYGTDQAGPPQHVVESVFRGVVSGVPESIEVSLSPGRNYFYIEALNLGDVPPNTVDITITASGLDGGFGTRTLRLEQPGEVAEVIIDHAVPHPPLPPDD
ncbi:MAG: hypothetical protein KJ057_16325 [Phycisphaerae bacterium]|nr:hypothetical protein [Planctomycetia bacterium]MCL4720035.1 hypothetical protein [Phycisphaerae bacterium]